MKTRHFSKEESSSNSRSTNAKLRSINYQKKIVPSFALLSLISGFLGFANVAQAACTTSPLKVLPPR